MRDYAKVNASVLWSAVGIFPVLCLSSEEVAGLTADDLDVLTRDLGMSNAMLDHLRDLAREPGRAFRLDFDRQEIVSVEGDPEK